MIQEPITTDATYMPTPDISALGRKQRERLIFIEFRLWFLGDIGRPALMDRFGIAPAVATRDLSLYRKLAPGNVDFDGSRKVYVPNTNFQPIFEHSPERVLSALTRGFGEGQPTERDSTLPCDFPVRLNRPNLDVLATVTRAIHQGYGLDIKYHSLNRGLSERTILPFALVDSGLRWHTRVFDRLSGEFRDLVITRIEATIERPDIRADKHELPDRDAQWSRLVDLELIPHPKQNHPDIVARDFGMGDDKLLKIRVRAAIAGYVLRQWVVDCSTERNLDPSIHRLCLKDPLNLYGVNNAVLAPGFKEPK
jgi:hypothetical protein